MQFWPELTYKLYANSNVNCIKNVQDSIKPMKNNVIKKKKKKFDLKKRNK